MPAGSAGRTRRRNRPEAEERLHHLLMQLLRHAGLLHPEPGGPGHGAPLSVVFALHELDLGTPLTQGELAARLGLEKSTVSRLVSDMERDRLLERERDPENRRYFRLRITRQGRAMHHRMATGFHVRYDRLLESMSAQERRALLVGLDALVRALQEVREEDADGSDGARSAPGSR